jgi:hypothetical protein
LATFEQVQWKYSRPRSIGLIFALTIVIITCVLFVCVLVTCLLLRRHRRRHQTAIAARNKLLCSSSQQLTSSGSTTTTSSSSSSSMEHQIIGSSTIQIQPSYWTEKLYDERSSRSYNGKSMSSSGQLP